MVGAPQVPEEYPVFNCVLSHENYTGEGVEQVVVVENPTPLPTYFARTLEKLSMPGVPQTMADDLRSLSGQILCLENRFNLKKRVVLVSTAEIEQLFHAEDKMGWNRFRHRFPASSGITTLSKVAFDADHAHALVYVGNQRDWRSGSGTVFFLGRTQGEWKIERSRIVWLS
jgi:hypothetical protein